RRGDRGAGGESAAPQTQKQKEDGAVIGRRPLADVGGVAMSINQLDVAVGVVGGLRDVARLPLYRSTATAPPSRVGRTYTTDAEFWSKVLERKIGMGAAVRLKGFVLTAWVPRSPGTYWKAESLAYRQAAESDVIENKKYPVYGPHGKSLRVLGGVGSVRM